MTQDKLLTMGLDEIDNFLNSSEGDFASFGDTIILDDDKLNQMTTDDYQVDLNVLDSTKDEVDDVDVINPFTEGTSETKVLTKTELDDLFSDIIQDVDAKEVKKEEAKKTERKATAFKPADDFDIELDDEDVQETKKPERKATAFQPADDFDIELDAVIKEEPKKNTRKATAFKPAEDFDIELDESVVQEEPKKTTRKATTFSTSDEITDSDIEFMETEIEEAVVVEEVEEKPKKQRKATKKVIEEVGEEIEVVEEKPKRQRKTSKKKEEKVEVIEEQAVHAEQILTEEDVQDIRTVIRDVIYKEVRLAFKDAIKNVANDLLGK